MTYAIAWCDGNEPNFNAIFYYTLKKQWEYVGPKLKDIIVGYDPLEDWEWGFHIIDNAADRITKEDAEKITGFQINEEQLKSELSRVLAFIKSNNITSLEQLRDLEPLNINK